jgi:hypothetical protein
MIMSSSTLYADDLEKKTNQELLDRLDTLEKQLKRMEDETKARKSLEVTEEEKVEKEKEVLEAVGREYSLSPKGTLSLDYSLSYQYVPSETFTIAEQATAATLELDAQRQANHTVTHSIYTSYSFLDNLTSNVNIPIVYRYNNMGTSESLTQTDVGDITVGVAFQPPYKWNWLKLPGDVRATYNVGLAMPTGRSPFKINPKTELSTGNGEYVANVGGSFSKQLDPVVVFWGLGYSYPLPLKNLDYRVSDQVTLLKVDPGSSINFNMGWGYALSYANSINMSFSYSYAFSTTYTYKELPKPHKSGDTVSASFGVGMGIAVTPKTSVSVSLGYSLIDAGFSLTTRIPFDFVI